jgi:outer membrane protein assembly factor BamB
MQARVFNQFGEGTSPALHGDTLVVKTDHNDGSFIAALNKLTGEVIWRQDRQDNRSWSAPAIVETEGRALVVISGNRTALAYDLKTGETVWSAQPQGGNAIPSAVANGELVFYKGGGQRGGGFQAVKLNAGGDLTAAPEAIAWSLPSVPTSVSSPLLVGSELYIVGDNGVVSCYNATTGEAHYQNQRLPGAYNFKSSPVCAGDRIYLAMEQGDVVVLKRGPTFEVLATVSMGEMLIASPAVAGSELFIRTQTELFCFRQGERSDRTGRLDAQRSRR